MSDELFPHRRLRAGDADRDAVLNVLQRAHAAGRLTVEELGERQDAALLARFTDEFPRLVADLPEGGELAVGQTTLSPRPHPLPAAVEGAHPSLTILTGREVDVAPGTTLYRNFAWWGGDTIHLDDVMGPGVVLTMELSAVMAGHDIFVPAGVRVIDESIAIMAGNDVESGARGDGSNGTLILKGFLFWAGNDVKLSSGR
ncbi:DUF1707 domain-containing protein [Tessaracoccus sp. MC1627]|uniref:DUF1707 SHOCT-like domain-containing protein n=1 Tax=Tessaracoccus sp. MC1627 TaxID=2760312 RepID=UPI0015FF5199|nr:DUF1707 domain-containing protein [Tessaracoccus sp. MC1627]MBB1511583.1 DUF1707 domain-containing protein [Tessaracoccus sp. MC1627]